MTEEKEKTKGCEVKKDMVIGNDDLKQKVMFN